MVKRLSAGAKAEIAEKKLREDVASLVEELDAYSQEVVRRKARVTVH